MYNIEGSKMSNTVTLRKLGGSTVVAIPPAFLDSLKCSIGDEMELRLKPKISDGVCI